MVACSSKIAFSSFLIGNVPKFRVLIDQKITWGVFFNNKNGKKIHATFRERFFSHEFDWLVCCQGHCFFLCVFGIDGVVVRVILVNVIVVIVIVVIVVNIVIVVTVVTVVIVVIVFADYKGNLLPINLSNALKLRMRPLYFSS